MVLSFGRCTCVFIFVQLLCPAGHLMSDQAARGPREADDTIWGLYSDILHAHHPISGLATRCRMSFA